MSLTKISRHTPFYGLTSSEKANTRVVPRALTAAESAARPLNMIHLASCQKNAIFASLTAQGIEAINMKTLVNISPKAYNQLMRDVWPGIDLMDVAQKRRVVDKSNAWILANAARYPLHTWEELFFCFGEESPQPSSLLSPSSRHRPAPSPSYAQTDEASRNVLAPAATSRPSQQKLAQPPVAAQKEPARTKARSLLPSLLLGDRTNHIPSVPKPPTRPQKTQTSSTPRASISESYPVAQDEHTPSQDPRFRYAESGSSASASASALAARNSVYYPPLPKLGSEEASTPAIRVEDDIARGLETRQQRAQWDEAAASRAGDAAEDGETILDDEGRRGKTRDRQRPARCSRDTGGGAGESSAATLLAQLRAQRELLERL